MPPLEPLPSQQAMLSKHLFTHGYPLWNPEPPLPQSEDRWGVGLKIGDVGTVDERGGFDIFFNILDPTSEGADNLRGLLINEDDVRHSSEDISPRQVVSSPRTSWHVEQLELETIGGVTRKTTQYGATLSNDGAHIIIPQGSQFFELGLQHRRIFENHARERGAKWLERWKDRLGWPRGNSIYLITGFHKTCSWAIASFSMQAAADSNPVGVHCTLMEVDERTIVEHSVWQPAGRFDRKIGPPPDSQGQNNQTVFVRAIIITPSPSCTGQAERQTALFPMFSSPARFLSTLAGSPTKATEAETSDGNIIIQHVPQISHARHPSEIINQYLLLNRPSAKIAVSHDSRWITMLEMLGKEQSWTLDDLENNLEEIMPKRYSIASYRDAVYLRDRQPTALGVDRPYLHKPVSTHPNPTDETSMKVVESSSTDDSNRIFKVVASDKKTSKACELAYTNCKVICSGSVGMVFRAKLISDSSKNPQTVAIKRVLQDKRLKCRELQIMRLVSHPNVVHCDAYFDSAGDKNNEVYCNLVLEYFPGTLYHAIRQYSKYKKSIPILQVKLHMYQLLRSLAYIHSIGVCHRNIEPRNLLLNPVTGVLKLSDFGSAKILVAGERNDRFIGKRYYRAPELLFGATNYTINIDIWSTGCVMAELVLGQRLFRGESSADQIAEIAKVLGTPSPEQVKSMNPDIKDCEFPQETPRPLNRVLLARTAEATDLVAKFLEYTPGARLSALEAIVHPFFNVLREEAGFSNRKMFPPLFNFTREELSVRPELNRRLVPPHCIPELETRGIDLDTFKPIPSE